jgi:Fur family transcriptional regulator, ferric uptake regulator
VAIIPTSFRAEINDHSSDLDYQHENILKVFEVLPPGSHLNIVELYKSLKKQEKVNISTVYHAVTIMVEMGVLRELEMATGQRYYKINASFPQEHHIVCVQCNRMIKFEDNSILQQSIQQAEKSDWHMLDCQLTIYGICAEANEIGCLAIHDDDIN